MHFRNVQKLAVLVALFVIGDSVASAQIHTIQPFNVQGVQRMVQPALPAIPHHNMQQFPNVQPHEVPAGYRFQPAVTPQPHQTYPQPPQTYPPQTQLPQTYPPQTLPPQTYPPQTYPPQTLPQNKYPQQIGEQIIRQVLPGVPTQWNQNVPFQGGVIPSLPLSATPRPQQGSSPLSTILKSKNLQKLGPQHQWDNFSKSTRKGAGNIFKNIIGN